MSGTGLDAYVNFFEQLTPDTLSHLGNVVTENVHFCDPFNDVHGRTAMEQVLKAMFKEIVEPAFHVTHRAWDGEVCFIRWTFKGRSKRFGGRDWSITGMSELRFAEDGRVAEHIDHWDSGHGFYEFIPVVGLIIKFMRRLAAVT